MLWWQSAAYLLILGVASPHLRAQQPSSAHSTVVVIDASEPASPVPPADYTPGTSTSPSWDRIGLNSLYLARNGTPWLPVMGEFQFSRYPEEEWEDEILKMKAGGVQVVSTYVMWIHHEEIQGEFDWTGQRNLRRFVQLCGRHGLYVYPRVGPWVHGEVRNGGFPDWVAKMPHTRTNDPAYLTAVNAYFQQLSSQLKGLLWKDGGPIIGIQIENEYANTSSLGGAAHILELKRILRADGLDVPLYTVTGWDGAVVPAGQVLPVGGGYPDAPWDNSNLDLPPNESYTFQFQTRSVANMGAIGAAEQHETAEAPMTPFLTAEVGGGIHSTYHRRPVVDADDVSAIATILVGSGANLLGYYVYHGAENPEGKLSTLNETRATGYATDLPIKSYDFRAPVGEFGQERTSYGRLRLLNYFLNDFGDLIAPMIARQPSILPKSPEDLQTPRLSARTHGNAGFLFVSDYVRGYRMAGLKNFQVDLKLPHSKMRIPERPVNIPEGSYLIWPFHLEMHGFQLRYATAQLFCKIEDAKDSTYFFFANPGVAPELSFDGIDRGDISVTSGSLTFHGSNVLVTGIVPGTDAVIELHRGQHRLRIIVLTRSQAEQSTRVTLQDGQHLILTAQELFSDDMRLVLRSTAGPDFHLSVFPALPHSFEKTLSIETPSSPQHAESFVSYTAHVVAVNVAVNSRQIRSGSPTVPGIAENSSNMPPASAMASSAAWHLDIPQHTVGKISNLFLTVRYTGDVARLTQDRRLLADNFYDGEDWTVGLKRFLPSLGAGHFELDISPWRPKASVILERSNQAAKRLTEIPQLASVVLTPQYEVVAE
jgi:hypothetical protein